LEKEAKNFCRRSPNLPRMRRMVDTSFLFLSVKRVVLWAPLGAAVLAGFSTPGRTQTSGGPPLPPLPYRMLQKLHADPEAWREFRAQHAAAAAPAPVAKAAPAGSLAWRPAFSGLMLSNPVLLTDGTVMAHISCTGYWHRLTPDIHGSYANGTWKLAAQMPAGYAPRFFASGVLPDGRMIVEGGEYNGQNCSDVETKSGAIYDPRTDQWTSVAAPAGWTTIGDAESLVLPNGTFLLSDCCGTALAMLDPKTLTWTSVPAKGKADSNNEENWTMLPDGDLLTVDAYTLGPGGGSVPCGKASEIYVPHAGLWQSAGSTINRLVGCAGTIKTFEAPTQILQPDGNVLVFGATAATTNQPVWTAIYKTSTGTWLSRSKMPDVGGQYYTMADAPAAILGNGEALLAASPGVWSINQNLWYPPPTHFFVFNGAQFSQIGDVGDSAQLSSYEMNFLVLPSGEILGVETDFRNSEILPAVCCAAPGAEPAIRTISSTTLAAGHTYSLTGKQLSGLTEGATYGDDGQAGTNFPLVRITNTATSHVAYARTFGFSRSVSPAFVSSTSFTLPAGIEAGASSLVVVANGVASAPVAVTVTAAGAQ
jgi:hypothetical protein